MVTQLLGLIGVGLLAGVLAGLAGVGGGIVIVPLLVFIFGFSQHMAQGTSLAVLIPPIGLLAMLQYYRKGEVDLKAAALIAAGLLIGSIFGAKLALGIPQEKLKKLFGAILFLASMRYLLLK
ncbi:MAG: sulfite exporter TauE/SafE family protein [Candidatus Eisenbacteria bacterium]|nr:sulfite exporter TauE/SafE family protein [Candidatus Eisenbacteria bacterium]